MKNESNQIIISQKYIKPDIGNEEMNQRIKCRICLENSNIQSVVLPCLCKGDLGTMHKACFQVWLGYSNTAKTCDQQDYSEVVCEVCKSTIRFFRQQSAQCRWPSPSKQKSKHKCLLIILITFFFVFGANSVFLLLTGLKQKNDAKMFVGYSLALLALFFLSFFVKGVVEQRCILRTEKFKFMRKNSSTLD